MLVAATRTPIFLFGHMLIAYPNTSPRIIMRSFIYVLPFILGACASAGPDNGNGNVAIETASNGQAVEGANCVVSNNAGQWNITTPANAPVGSPNGTLRVLCNKAGYLASEVAYQPSYGSSGSSVGLGVGHFGGHTGGGIGIGIPIGGFGRGGYPSTITVEMNPQ
jgi:hypothetical protein